MRSLPFRFAVGISVLFVLGCTDPQATSLSDQGSSSDAESGSGDSSSSSCDADWTTRLPILVIETDEKIVDDPRVVGRMGIIDNGEGEENCLGQPITGYDGRITIEYRGSTSQAHPKKSYGFETQDEDGNNANVSLLGLPAENDWVLYAPYSDKTMVRNVLAYRLFADMGRYSTRTRYCELVVNGEYWGVHVLTEKVKIDDNRVDVSRLDPEATSGDEITGGYLIKIDKPTGSGTEWWPSAYSEKYFFQFHYPKETVLNPEQRAYIQKYTGDFEDALWGPDFTDPDLGYRRYIDVGSFVDFMIMHELGRTVDGYRSSTFLYKDRDSLGGKLTMGPVWDFNISFGHCHYCHAQRHTGWQFEFNETCPDFETEIPFWWQRLLEDPDFANQLRCRWEELRAGALSTKAISALIDDSVARLEEPQARNFELWQIIGEYVDWNPFVGETWEEDVDYLRKWLVERTTWMDENLPGTCLGA